MVLTSREKLRAKDVYNHQQIVLSLPKDLPNFQLNCCTTGLMYLYLFN